MAENNLQYNYCKGKKKKKGKTQVYVATRHCSDVTTRGKAGLRGFAGLRGKAVMSPHGLENNDCQGTHTDEVEMTKVRCASANVMDALNRLQTVCDCINTTFDKKARNETLLRLQEATDSSLLLYGS